MFKVILFHLPPSGGDLLPIIPGYIGAALKRGGIDVHIEDLTLHQRVDPAHIERLISDYRPAVAGFSAYQPNMPGILSLSGTIKKTDPDIKIVLGGPQAMSMPAAALLDMPSVDILCRGEGESVLPGICSALMNGSGLKNVKGVAFKNGAGVVETVSPELIRDLDTLASPFAGGMFDYSSHRTACILSSRGCPFSCAFCTTPDSANKKVRTHSPERVVQDMENCVNSGIKDFWFADPAFAFYKGWAVEIMERIIGRKWRISMWVQTHSGLVDKPLLKAMAAAGVRKIAYGLESADRKVLNMVNKPVDIGRLRRIVRTTFELGMDVELMHIFGLPGQSYDSARLTMDFIKSLNVKIRGNSCGQQLKLYFGARLCREPEKFGLFPKRKKLPSFLSCDDEFETAWMDSGLIKKVKNLYERERRIEEAADALTAKRSGSHLKPVSKKGRTQP